jgi:hypothetical protein
MPLTLNIGLSRKTSENYNSKGVSINLTAELEQALLNRPDELQDRVAALYREAEQALERQENPNGHDQHSQPQPNGSTPRNGDGMTASQRRAIEAICKRLDTNPTDEARHEFGLDLDRMSIREASKFIDHLKALQPAGNENGRHRSETRTRTNTNGGRR